MNRFTLSIILILSYSILFWSIWNLPPTKFILAILVVSVIGIVGEKNDIR